MLLSSWNSLARIGFFSFVVGGILVLIFYLLRLSLIGEFKGKYDFIGKYEVKILWITSLLLTIGGAFYFNSQYKDHITKLEIFVRIFVSIAMGLVVSVVVRTLLNYYYPFYIEKRLKGLRYKPRISPKTGRPMKLLSEEEEDAHLDEGMQEEENLFSVNYDVWKDEETGYVKIEKYAGHLLATACPECNYQTLKLQREEIIRQPSGSIPGEVMKHFKCAYCGYKARKTVSLNSNMEASLTN